MQLKLNCLCNVLIYINELLSDLNSIVTAITEMKNKNSDAHEVGSRRITINEHHASLCVNVAVSMADFILSVQQKNING